MQSTDIAESMKAMRSSTVRLAEKTLEAAHKTIDEFLDGAITPGDGQSDVDVLVALVEALSTTMQIVRDAEALMAVPAGPPTLSSIPGGASDPRRPRR